MVVRARQGGFTLTELMVVVVIVGVLSAVATPYLGRDRAARAGRDFASSVANDLQRSRMQAVTDRLPIRAFIYRDRIELRSATPGATPGAAPTAPVVATPILRVVPAPSNVDILDVLPTATAPTAQTLTTATFKQIEFTQLGQAQLVGSPPLTGAFLYVRNRNVPDGHPDEEYRVRVTALTGHVDLGSRW